MDEEYQIILTRIQSDIITNGNNEITANVLRPILEEMLSYFAEKAGNLDNLQTDDKTNLVNAINEVLNSISDSSGVSVYSGINDPNNIPPLDYSIGDMYSQLTEANTPIALFIYTGLNWVNLSNTSGGSNSGHISLTMSNSGVIQNNILIGAIIDAIAANNMIWSDLTSLTDYSFNSSTGTISGFLNYGSLIKNVIFYTKL